MDTAVRTIRSPDGTTIAVERTGTGSPLVLVSGALTDRTQWRRVLPLLAERHAVYAVDRRGRGGSGDRTGHATDGYHPRLEIDDVVAVLDAVAEETGRPVNVLGHSSGALLVLGAARAAARVRRVVGYEPPIGRDTGALDPPLSARLAAHVAAGDRETAVLTFLREGVGLPADQVDLVRRAPTWPASVALAHTVPYDMRIQEESRRARDGFAGLGVPVLLLLGTASSEWMAQGLRELAATLPDARLVSLPDQGHLAMVDAPALFAERVLEFLTEP
ncbi:alpha/beta fold hydrolase [Gandjariella thermophila]|uniref:Alpha/beta hydrolase n=1 Tax=Gandjariella thermophila TaxID=1931992 RepID=A0A4D4J8I1_9PSEU|nr:alpha/beta hydrolase [Gandjariella thermophila]GDY32971.1 alpha/beta hydrolase [Gandjariella thermophila]